MTENTYKCSICDKVCEYEPSEDPPADYYCNHIGCMQAWALKQILLRIELHAREGLENFEMYQKYYRKGLYK